MKKSIKLITLAVAFVMALCFMSGCGETSEDGPSGSSNGITIFNSKMEIQDQMLEMAKRYTEETGVPVEVYYSSDICLLQYDSCPVSIHGHLPAP